MSDPFTSVETPSGGVGEWGYLSREDAVAALRAHFEHQAEQARKVLAEIEAGEVRVFHQLGPWAARNRREVPPDSPGQAGRYSVVIADSIDVGWPM